MLVSLLLDKGAEQMQNSRGNIISQRNWSTY